MVMRPLQRPLPQLWYGLRSNYGHDARRALWHECRGAGLGRAHRGDASRASARHGTRTRRSGGAWARRNAEPLIGAMRAVFVADRTRRPSASPVRRTSNGSTIWCWLWKENGSYPPIALSPDFEEATESGSLVAGSPATVRRKLLAQARRIGFNYLVLHLAFGSLGHAREMRSLALFRDEVMPALVNEGARVAAK